MKVLPLGPRDHEKAARVADPAVVWTSGRPRAAALEKKARKHLTDAFQAKVIDAEPAEQV
jgi:hypothetical protein